MDTWSSHECLAFDLHLQQERGLPAALLMENAGGHLARRALALARRLGASEIAVVAGPGNNGGDGLVAARHLHLLVPVLALTPLGVPGRPASPAALAADCARRLGIPLQEGPLPAAWRPRTMIIDALFGLGLARPLVAGASGVVEAINASGCRVLAVDLPSGLDGDSGRVMGVAVRADWTLSFVGRKRGMDTGAGPAHCGEIEIADIGVSAAYASQWLAASRRGIGHSPTPGMI